MDVVSVNLSRADAALVVRAVERELDGCGCAGRAASRCDRCEALGAIRSDLVRLLVGRAPRSSRPLVPLLRSCRHPALDLPAAGWSPEPAVSC